MNEDEALQWQSSIKPDVLEEYEKFAQKNELPEYLKTFGYLHLAAPPDEVAGMLRGIRCTSKEFWRYTEEYCRVAGGGSHNMEDLLYIIMLAGRTSATRTNAEKRKKLGKITTSIKRLIADLEGDPLANELTVPALAETRANNRLDELHTSLEEPLSERGNLTVGLTVGPRLPDLLQGALVAYEKEMEGNSILGPHSEDTATALHPKNIDDRRIYFYTCVIDWFKNLSAKGRIDKNLISQILDAILTDENQDLVGSGDAWKNALRKVGNAQENNKR